MFLMSQLHYSLQPLATTHKKFGRKVDLGGCQLPCDHFGRKEVAVTALKTSQSKWSPGYVNIQRYVTSKA